MVNYLNNLLFFMGMIGLSKANTSRYFVEQRIFNEGYAEGYAEGQLLMAIKLVDKFGVDVVCEISGFSREELSKK